MMQRNHYYQTPRPHPNYRSFMPYEYYGQAFHQDVPIQDYPSQFQQNPNQTPYDYFQKPEQPMNWPNNTPYDVEQPMGQEMNQQANMQQQPNLASQFQKDGGQLDFDKVLTTVGQLASTYHQVAPIIQQFNGFLKSFRA
ncbi:YppG family protein [Oceanobacillus bengalensis]|nr:YppG family protein [Oceanobacillus bengalensis]